MLQTLVSHQGKPVAYRLILHAVWGPDYGDEVEKVRGVVKQIRKKIEKDPANPCYIVTDSWFGYRVEIPLGNGKKLQREL